MNPSLSERAHSERVFPAPDQRTTQLNFSALWALSALADAFALEFELGFCAGFPIAVPGGMNDGDFGLLFAK